MKLGDLSIGSEFVHNHNVYLRVKDMDMIKRSYPCAVIVVNLDTYEIVLLHEEYEVDQLIKEAKEVYYE